MNIFKAIDRFTTRLTIKKLHRDVNALEQVDLTGLNPRQAKAYIKKCIRVNSRAVFLLSGRNALVRHTAKAAVFRMVQTPLVNAQKLAQANTLN